MSYRRPILALIVLLIATFTAHGQPADSNRFVIYVHAGYDHAAPPKPDPVPDVVKKISVGLATRGYLVRAPDDQHDTVGGPGVDYFFDADEAAAKDIAATVNALLQGAGTPLSVRRQNVKNAPGTIGLWLFK